MTPEQRPTRQDKVFFSSPKHPKADGSDEAFGDTDRRQGAAPHFDFVSSIGTSAEVRQWPKCTRGT